MAGAVLGLAAFMLAFAFDLLDVLPQKCAFCDRKPNAIRTAYLRSNFLPEPDRAEAKRLLQGILGRAFDYGFSGNIEPEHVKNVLSETERIQGRLWDIAVVNARKDMNSTLPPCTSMH